MIGENKKKSITEKNKQKLNLLSEIAYFQQTILRISEELQKIVETVCNKLIPALVGGHVINNPEQWM